MLYFLVFTIVIGAIGFIMAKNEMDNFSAPQKISDNRQINADDLRVQGELMSLYTGLFLIALLLLFLLRITLGAILIFIIIGIVWVKIRQGQFLGQAVKVNKDQLPDIYTMAQQAAKNLSMTMPDVFVTQNPLINAYALGFFGKKSIMLHSATVEAMTKEELCSIIGHEFTHIKCMHTHWLVLTHLKDAIRIPVVSDLLGLLLLRWSRKAEYTCDRGGLLACRNLRSSISALAKVAVGKTLFTQLNLDAFARQHENVTEDDIARLAENLVSHPYIVNRIQALGEFSQSKYYHSIV
jgi:Zn-dependent protease with chaperone function